VHGDTIVEVAARSSGSARRVVDAGGQVVAPGFVDLHTHARHGIFAVPSAENYVRQGVTTLVEGQDGSSPLPLGPFLDKVEALGPGVNFASLVGHGSIREAVLGRANRAPTAAELARMQELVQQAMRQGAQGIKIEVAGRLAGAEMARTVWLREGRVPLQTLRAEIDFARAEALTTYGRIGVKVWVFKGEMQPEAEEKVESTDGVYVSE
jgi:N-acyl-D-aspartate/D-glutamate deacylase